MVDKIEPRSGTFSDIPDGAEIPRQPQGDMSKLETGIYYAEDLIAIYNAFRDKVYNPKSVLYPSCGFDASPARVFDTVTFVDIEDGNEGCVKKLQEAGLHAIKQDIRGYTPKDLHDLLILLNSTIPVEWASRHLKSGGYIITNDYPGNGCGDASEMFRQPEQFTLWGAMDWVEQDRRTNDYRVNISRNLEDLFQPVKDAEEFKRLRPADFEFEREGVVSFIKEGHIHIDPNASFDQKWAEYREVMQERMPYKRVAERYIFMKK